MKFPRIVTLNPCTPHVFFAFEGSGTGWGLEKMKLGAEPSETISPERSKEMMTVELKQEKCPEYTPNFIK